MKKQGYRFKKTCALGTAVLFLVSSVLATVPSAAQALPEKALPELTFPITLPENLGKVIASSSQGQFRADYPAVLILQNAHALTDAQEKIHGIIEHLTSTYDVPLVALEGGSGDLDATLLQTFPDSNVKEKVLRQYLKRGELTGADLSLVLGSGHVQYTAVEDWDFYEANYFAYLAAHQMKEKILQKLEVLQKQQDLSREKFYSPELKRIYSVLQNFYAERETLSEVLVILMESSAGEKLIRSYPHLQSLWQILNSETEAENSSRIILRRLAEEFKTNYLSRFSVQEQAEFNGRYQAFSAGESGQAEFLRYLIQFGQKKRLKVVLPEGLRLMAENMQSLSLMKGTILYDEFQAFTHEVQISLAENEEQKELIAGEARFRLLSDLALLELTQADYHRFLQQPDVYLSLLGDDQVFLDPAMTFYRWASRRDETLFKNLLKTAKKKNAQSVLFIAGGFHSRGMEEQLRRLEIPYAVITPAMDSFEGEELYEKLMLGDVSYKDYLETSFYDAFSKKITEDLARELDPQVLKKTLKVWHDNIIRTLAGRNQIGETAQYFKYLDRLMKKHFAENASSGIPAQQIADLESKVRQYASEKFQVYRGNVLRQFEKFAADLERLLKNKELTPETLKKLLQPPAGPVSVFEPPVSVLPFIPNSDQREEGFISAMAQASGFSLPARRTEQIIRRSELRDESTESEPLDPWDSQQEGESRQMDRLRKYDFSADKQRGPYFILADFDFIHATNAIFSKQLVGTLGKAQDWSLLFSKKSLYREAREKIREFSAERGIQVHRYIGGDEFVLEAMGAPDDVQERLTFIFQKFREYFLNRYRIYRVQNAGNVYSEEIRQQFKALESIPGILSAVQHGNGFNLLIDETQADLPRLESMIRSRAPPSAEMIRLDDALTQAGQDPPRGLFSFSAGVISAGQVMRHLQQVMDPGYWVNESGEVHPEKVYDFYRWGIRAANDMLQKAKQQGRNRFYFFEGELRAEDLLKPITAEKILDYDHSFIPTEEGRTTDALTGTMQLTKFREEMRRRLDEHPSAFQYIRMVPDYGLGQERAFHLLQDRIGYQSANQVIQQIASLVRSIMNLPADEDGLIARLPPDTFEFGIPRGIGMWEDPATIRAMVEKINRFKNEVTKLLSRIDPDLAGIFEPHFTLYTVGVSQLKQIPEESNDRFPDLFRLMDEVIQTSLFFDVIGQLDVQRMAENGLIRLDQNHTYTVIALNPQKTPELLEAYRDAQDAELWRNLELVRTGQGSVPQRSELRLHEGEDEEAVLQNILQELVEQTRFDAFEVRRALKAMADMAEDPSMGVAFDFQVFQWIGEILKKHGVSGRDIPLLRTLQSRYDRAAQLALEDSKRAARIEEKTALLQVVNEWQTFARTHPTMQKFWQMKPVRLTELDQLETKIFAYRHQLQRNPEQMPVKDQALKDIERTLKRIENYRREWQRVKFQQALEDAQPVIERFERWYQAERPDDRLLNIALRHLILEAEGTYDYGISLLASELAEVRGVKGSLKTAEVLGEEPPLELLKIIRTYHSEHYGERSELRTSVRDAEDLWKRIDRLLNFAEEETYPSGTKRPEWGHVLGAYETAIRLVEQSDISKDQILEAGFRISGPALTQLKMAGLYLYSIYSTFKLYEDAWNEYRRRRQDPALPKHQQAYARMEQIPDYFAKASRHLRVLENLMDPQNYRRFIEDRHLPRDPDEFDNVAEVLTSLERDLLIVLLSRIQDLEIPVTTEELQSNQYLKELLVSPSVEGSEGNYAIKKKYERRFNSARGLVQRGGKENYLKAGRVYSSILYGVRKWRGTFYRDPWFQEILVKAEIGTFLVFYLWLSAQVDEVKKVTDISAEMFSVEGSYEISSWKVLEKLLNDWVKTIPDSSVVQISTPLQNQINLPSGDSLKKLGTRMRRLVQREGRMVQDPLRVQIQVLPFNGKIQYQLQITLDTVSARSELRQEAEGKSETTGKKQPDPGQKFVFGVTKFLLMLLGSVLSFQYLTSVGIQPVIPFISVILFSCLLLLGVDYLTQGSKLAFQRTLAFLTPVLTMAVIFGGVIFAAKIYPQYIELQSAAQAAVVAPAQPGVPSAELPVKVPSQAERAEQERASRRAVPAQPEATARQLPAPLPLPAQPELKIPEAPEKAVEDPSKNAQPNPNQVIPVTAAEIQEALSMRIDLTLSRDQKLAQVDRLVDIMLRWMYPDASQEDLIWAKKYWKAVAYVESDRLKTREQYSAGGPGTGLWQAEVGRYRQSNGTPIGSFTAERTLLLTLGNNPRYNQFLPIAEKIFGSQQAMTDFAVNGLAKNRDGGKFKENSERLRQFILSSDPASFFVVVVNAESKGVTISDIPHTREGLRELWLKKHWGGSEEKQPQKRKLFDGLVDPLPLMMIRIEGPEVEKWEEFFDLEEEDPAVAGRSELRLTREQIDEKREGLKVVWQDNFKRSILFFSTVSILFAFGKIFFAAGFFFTVVLHELGHWAVAKYVQKKYGTISRLILNIWGANVRRIPAGEFSGTVRQEAWIRAAGPVINLLAGAAFLSGLFVAERETFIHSLILLSIMNFAVGLSNFLPIRGSDGRVLWELYKMRKLISNLQKRYDVPIDRILGFNFDDKMDVFVKTQDRIYLVRQTNASAENIEVIYKAVSLSLAPISFPVKGTLIQSFDYQRKTYALYEIRGFPPELAGPGFTGKVKRPETPLEISQGKRPAAPEVFPRKAPIAPRVRSVSADDGEIELMTLTDQLELAGINMIALGRRSKEKNGTKIKIRFKTPDESGYLTHHAAEAFLEASEYSVEPGVSEAVSKVVNGSAPDFANGLTSNGLGRPGDFVYLFSGGFPDVLDSDDKKEAFLKALFSWALKDFGRLEATIIMDSDKPYGKPFFTRVFQSWNQNPKNLFRVEFYDPSEHENGSVKELPAEQFQPGMELYDRYHTVNRHKNLQYVVSFKNTLWDSVQRSELRLSDAHKMQLLSLPIARKEIESFEADLTGLNVLLSKAKFPWTQWREGDARTAFRFIERMFDFVYRHFPRQSTMQNIQRIRQLSTITEHVQAQNWSAVSEALSAFTAASGEAGQSYRIWFELAGVINGALTQLIAWDREMKEFAAAQGKDKKTHPVAKAVTGIPDMDFWQGVYPYENAEALLIGNLRYIENYAVYVQKVLEHRIFKFKGTLRMLEIGSGSGYVTLAVLIQILKKAPRRHFEMDVVEINPRAVVNTASNVRRFLRVMRAEGNLINPFEEVDDEKGVTFFVDNIVLRILKVSEGQEFEALLQEDLPQKGYHFIHFDTPAVIPNLDAVLDREPEPDQAPVISSANYQRLVKDSFDHLVVQGRLVFAGFQGDKKHIPAALTGKNFFVRETAVEEPLNPGDPARTAVEVIRRSELRNVLPANETFREVNPALFRWVPDGRLNELRDIVAAGAADRLPEWARVTSSQLEAALSTAEQAFAEFPLSSTLRGALEAGTGQSRSEVLRESFSAWPWIAVPDLLEMTGIYPAASSGDSLSLSLSIDPFFAESLDQKLKRLQLPAAQEISLMPASFHFVVDAPGDKTSVDDIMKVLNEELSSADRVTFLGDLGLGKSDTGFVLSQRTYQDGEIGKTAEALKAESETLGEHPAFIFDQNIFQGENRLRTLLGGDSIVTGLSQIPDPAIQRLVFRASVKILKYLQTMKTAEGTDPISLLYPVFRSEGLEFMLQAVNRTDGITSIDVGRMVTLVYETQRAVKRAA